MSKTGENEDFEILHFINHQNSGKTEELLIAVKRDSRSLQQRNLLINIDIFYHRVSFNVPLMNVINGDLKVSGSRTLILSRRQMKGHRLLILTLLAKGLEVASPTSCLAFLSVCGRRGVDASQICVCKTLCDLYAAYSVLHLVFFFRS